MCGDQRVSRIQNKRWFGISSGSPARSAVRARGQVRAPPPPSSSSPVLLFLLLLLHAPLADSLRLKGGIPSQITSNARIKFTHALSPSLFFPLPLTLSCLRFLPFKRAPNGSRTPAGRGEGGGVKKKPPNTPQTIRNKFKRVELFLVASPRSAAEVDAPSAPGPTERRKYSTAASLPRSRPPTLHWLKVLTHQPS